MSLEAADPLSKTRRALITIYNLPRKMCPVCTYGHQRTRSFRNIYYIKLIFNQLIKEQHLYGSERSYS